MSSQTVDILLATYNGGTFLPEQIESIFSQTFTNWRIIARDDGSTDETVQVLREYATRYPGRINVVVNPEKALRAKDNFARLMEYATAPYIMFCDQDDVWLPDKIEVSLKRIVELEKVFGQGKPLLLHTDLKVVNSKLEPIGDSFWKYQNLQPEHSKCWRNLLVQNTVTGCTTLFNRSLARLAHPIPPRAIMHDWWLALVASLFGRVEYLNQQTVLYRQHSSNDTGAKAWGWPWIKSKLLSPDDVRSSLLRTQEQAAALVERYGQHLDATVSSTLATYGSLSELPPLARRSFIVRNRLWKTGWVRNLGLLWAV